MKELQSKSLIIQALATFLPIHGNPFNSTSFTIKLNFISLRIQSNTMNARDDEINSLNHLAPSNNTKSLALSHLQRRSLQHINLNTT
ncbi:hypothetical protein VNO77_09981 [Canavalia gladiata]|uniref:Uncharacterized protein n=1 Tax=Canavalia gladiata TaxID=3824 RepID=A0AAN9MBA7_CANGL